MDHYSQLHLKQAATKPEHAVRHEEFERTVGTASHLLTWNRSSLTASVNEINDRLNNYTASANFIDLPTRDIVADETLLPSIPVSGILKNHWYDIAYAPELDLCVACADSTGGGPIGSTMYSQNLVQWTHAGPNSTEHVNTRCDTICYSNELRMFVAASTQDAFLGYSFDGVKFRQTAVPHKGFKAVCWSQELRMFVAVAQEGRYRAAYSYNGIDWIFLEIGQTEVWKAVCWAKELRLFVAVGIDGVCMYSRDGIVWTIVPKDISSLSGSLYNVKWSKALGKLITVGTSGTFRGAWSEDAEHWTPISNENGLSDSNEWVGLCVADELSLMIAVARSGVNRIAYTEDGLTWTPVGIENGVREDIQWRAAVWVKEKQVLACIGYNGSAYVGNDCPAQIMYSFDGKNYLSYSLQTARGISNKYARHDHAHIDREKGKLQDLATAEKTTLVGAINELFLFAGNGKSAITSVIGDPLQVSDGWDAMVSKIQASKNAGAGFLTQKGVASSGDESIDVLFRRIADIRDGNSPVLLIPDGIWVGADWSDDMVVNEYGRFVRNGSFVDLAEYPQLAGHVTEIPQMVTPEMTSDSSPSPFRAFASGGVLTTASQAWHAFATSTSNGYVSQSNSTNARRINVTLDFGESRELVRGVLSTSTFGTSRTYAIFGSHDNVTFETIKSGTSTTVTFAQPTIYRYYRAELYCWQGSSTSSTSRITYVAFYAPSLYQIPARANISGLPAYLKFDES